MSSTIYARFYYVKPGEINNVSSDKEVSIVNFLKEGCYDMDSWDERIESIDYKYLVNDESIIDKKSDKGIWFSIDSFNNYLNILINDMKVEMDRLNKLYNLKNSLDFYKLNDDEKESLEDDIRYHNNVMDETIQKYHSASKMIGTMQVFLDRFESKHEEYWGGDIYAHCFIEW